MNSTENKVLRNILILAIIILAITLIIVKPDEPFKVLALLGALSWLIILAEIITKLFIKPKISIILGKEIELGFNSLGPIINNQMAILSENKPALIKNIEVQLKHESSAIHNFSWQWFEEQLYEMSVPDNIQNINARKNQKATAIKIDSQEMVEKKIGFQQSKYLDESRKLIQKLNKKFVILNKNDPQNISELKTSNEYNDLIQYAGNSFVWKVGKYNLEYKVYILGIETAFKTTQVFELTDLDISTLKLNVEIFNKTIDASYGLTNEQIPNYYWVYSHEIKNAV